MEAAAVQLQTLTAERSGVVTGTQAVDVAINGRNYTSLLRTIPGVPADAGTGDHNWLIFGTGPSELGVHPTGPMHDGSIADLGLLIHAIAEIDGIGRIRFMTSHPLEFSDSLIDAYANVPKLANFLHLPVQSGSDRILAAMKRGYTALEFKQKIRKLRAVRPDISISSDFIIGFPGETEADFEKTMKLIDEPLSIPSSTSSLRASARVAPACRGARSWLRCAAW